MLFPPLFLPLERHFVVNIFTFQRLKTDDCCSCRSVSCWRQIYIISMVAVSLMELRLIGVMFNTTPFMKRDDNVLVM
jgi:hypothetical protein